MKFPSLPSHPSFFLKASTLFVYALFLSVCSYEHAASQHHIIVRPSFEESPARRSFFPAKSLKRPKIALVLSGGGARGVAHIGILKALEEHHVPIDVIIGTSMGGIVGGLYASGYSTDQLRVLIDTTDWTEVLSFTDQSQRTDLFVDQKRSADRNLLTIRFSGLTPVIPSSFTSGQRITKFINRLTLQGIYHPNPSFDDLKIPLRVVATDLVSGKRVIMDSGDLSEALRASMSVPLLYSFVLKDSLQLTEGGLISNIPVDVALDMNMDIIIAVDATSPLRSAEQMNAPWEIADQIIGIMAQHANEEAVRKSTIVIRPDLGNHLASDFSGLDSLIIKGREAALAMIPALEDSIEYKRHAEFSAGPDISQQSISISSISFQGDIPEDIASEFRSLQGKTPVTLGKIKEEISLLYALGNFRDVSAEITPSDSSASVVIIATANPLLRSIALSGNKVISDEEILPIFQPLKNRPLNNEKTRESLEEILSLYRDGGFSLARIQSSEFDSTAGILRVTINEGIIYRMVIRGTKKSRDWVIWRELPFTQGEVFTVSKAQEGVANLYATNLFDQILIDTRYLGPFPEVIIRATERKSELLRMGLRVDNERNLQPSFELRDENFLGTATEWGLGFAGGLRNRRYDAEFKANRIFNTYNTFNLHSYYDLRDIYTYVNDPLLRSRTEFSRLRIGEYRQTKYGIELSLGRQVERLGNVTADYRLERNAIRFLNGSGYDTSAFTLQALRLSSIVDTQDRFPFPTAGSLVTITYETATSRVGGEVGYSRILFTYEWFTTYYCQHTIHPKVTFGFADKTLPLTQQFTLGGEQSFYGLLQDDSRGRQVFVINLEYRALLPFRLVWSTYARVRYDFGSIWPKQEDIRLRDLHHGVGIGFAVNTPIGPASLSIGRSFYVRRDLLDEPLTLGPIVAYFSLGYAL